MTNPNDRCPSGERTFRGAPSGGGLGGHAVADAQKRLAGLGLDRVRGLDVGFGCERGIEQLDAELGIEEPFGVGGRSQPGAGIMTARARYLR